jgi:hypothetical protein
VEKIMNLVVCRVGCLFICLAILLIKLQNDELTFMAVWLGGDSQAWTEEGDKIWSQNNKTIYFTVIRCLSN